MFKKREIFIILTLLFFVLSGVGAITLNPVLVSPLVENAITRNTQTAYTSIISERESNSNNSDTPELRLLKVYSDPTYPVVPGDQYQLTYTNNNKIENLLLTVPYDKKINLGSLGIMDASSFTYLNLKERIETIVRDTYQYSNPQLLILGTGLFPVTVKGEVKSTTFVNAWGLSTLSDVAYLATDNASIRKVNVIKKDGRVLSYDLYKALMEGDDGQNPKLEINDTVVFLPRGKVVEIQGSVVRAGSYQIEDDEDLKTVVNRYAKGLLVSGNRQEISVIRSTGLGIEEFVVNFDSDDTSLMDGDVIIIKSSEIEYPSISVEGALLPSSASDYIQGAYNYKYFYKFLPGESYFQLFSTIASLFTSYSDLKEAVLIRGGEEIKLNIEEILYKNEKNGMIRLEAGDRIVIPFSQMLVTVNGAVNRPGTFGYVPGKNLNYYLNLAGGLSSSAKGYEKIKVFDKYSNQIDKSEVIPSEATIEVERDNFATNIAPIVTVVGLVSTVVAILVNVITIANAVGK